MINNYEDRVLTSGSPITILFFSFDDSDDVFSAWNAFDERVASAPSGPATASKISRQSL